MEMEPDLIYLSVKMIHIHVDISDLAGTYICRTYEPVHIVALPSESW